MAATRTARIENTAAALGIVMVYVVVEFCFFESKFSEVVYSFLADAFATPFLCVALKFLSSLLGYE